MRQGQQQNRRGRGRGRKPQNPLARSFESNGPDVKIRGTASHIAEKYTSLARDALSSGDLITAESYLQYAEHYNRIIMAAQAQFGGQGNQPLDGQNGGVRSRWEDGDDDEDDGPQPGQDMQGRGETQGHEGRGSEGRGGESRGQEGRGQEGRGEGRVQEGRGPENRGGERRDNRGEGRGPGRDHRRQAANGSEAHGREGNGADKPETQAADESAPDPVS
ncbi:MAG: DUF4167 domain-containing protein [Planctomycetes bacterium]|nr:DUF4167 domain-containing protein [Planctomycetota bacterium]